MKMFIYVPLTFILIVHSISQLNAQCPAVPACTQTAVSGTSYSVGVAVVLCINSNYNSGTITLNGGKVIVQSGGNLNSSMSISTGTINIASGGTLSNNLSPSGATIVNNCGTIASSSGDFNTNVTLNNYSSTAFTLKYSGNVVNNYAANALISFGDVTTAGTLTNFALNLKFNITNNWNSNLTFNNAVGASMEITDTHSTNMTAGSVINNSGTFTYTPVLSTIGGTFNNAVGATLNFTSSSSANEPIINNLGTMKTTGDFYLGSHGVITNTGKMTVTGQLRIDGGQLDMKPNSTLNVTTFYKNGGTVNMYDHSLLNIATNITSFNGTSINLVSGCATIMGSTVPSNNSINSSLLSNINLNFCGSAPTQNPALISLTSVANNGSGAYRITMSSGPNNNEFVQISGVTGVSNLNGYWKVTRINATTFDLIGSTYTAGAVYGSSQVAIDQSKLMLGTGTYLGYSGCTNPCAPLPIKLVSFTAVKDVEENNCIKITWQTIEEKNNSYYEIQRSVDCIRYETITTVRGYRNSSSLITYSDYDYAPLAGTSYYRLKQVDIDGSYSYSSIAVIEMNDPKDWVIYPNPSINGSFTLVSTFANNEVISIVVTDVTGNRVRYYDSSLYAQEMYVSNLSSGLYIISIQTVTTMLSKKLIVR